MGRAHDTRRCAERTCCPSGKGRFATCSGRNRTGIFFPLFIYSSIQAFFFAFVSRPVDSTRPDQQCFSFWKRPGGRLLPYFCSKKRPGGAISGLFYGTPRGAFTPFFTASCTAFFFSRYLRAQAQQYILQWIISNTKITTRYQVVL